MLQLIQTTVPVSREQRRLLRAWTSSKQNRNYVDIFVEFNMKKLKFHIMILLATASAGSMAQGMPPPAHPNSPYYVPPGAQSGNGITPNAPELKWVNRWGAIASDGKGNYGISGQFDSSRSAKKAAILDCEKTGGVNCKIKIAYHNQCAAIAASDGGRTFLQTDAYEDTAKELALERCSSSYGKDSCWIYYSGCSLPVRVQ